MKDLDKALVDNVLNDHASISEARMIVKWMKTNAGQAYLADCLERRFEHEAYNTTIDVPSEKMKHRLFNSLLRRKLSSWKWISVAAAIVFIVAGISLYLFAHSLSMEDKMEWKITSIPNGKRGHVILSDGTSVYLGAGANLKYPQSFNPKERLVYLSGEGYFDVSANPNYPFCVDLGVMKVKVTGTSFSIMASGDNSKIRLKLDKGHVSVFTGTLSKVILPGEYMLYDKRTHQLRISHEAGAYYADWKSGICHFNDAPLTTVLSVLECEFNVRFKIKNVGVKTYHYTMTLSDTPLEDVLKNMEISAPIRFTRDKNGYNVEMK